MEYMPFCHRCKGNIVANLAKSSRSSTRASRSHTRRRCINREWRFTTTYWGSDATDALRPLGRDLFNRTSLKDIRGEDLVIVWISCAASRNTDLSGVRISWARGQDPGFEVESTLRIAPVTASPLIKAGRPCSQLGEPAESRDEWQVVTFAQSRALC